MFTEPTYRYRLVGLDPQSPRFVSYLPDDSEEVVVSRFPFSDLAPIASHLKPHFAIYDCGHKLNNGIPTAAIEHGIVSRETIQNMLALYQAWISPLPFHNFPPGTYKNHRLRHIPQRAKRRYSGDHEGERSPVRIRKRLSDTDQEARSEHGDPVFAAGLAELNRQFDPHVHPNAIESWISDTVPTSDNDTSNGANIVPASYS